MLTIKLYNIRHDFTIKFTKLGVSLAKNFKTIKTFYRLSKVKPFLIFLMFLTLIIPAVLSVWTPILVSNTITAITVYDFDKALRQTVIEFGVILVSALLYFFYHKISVRVNRAIITNFQNYIYHNVKNNKNVKNINVSVLKDISTCVNFNKNLIYKFCFFIKSLIILGVILYYSYILALGIVAVSIISFFLLKLTDNKIQAKTQQLSKYENISIGLFNSICGGDSAEQNYNLEYALKDKYFQYVEENIKTSNSISMLYNINNNFISLILKAAVFASTLFLIGQVKSTEITLSVYLVLTPYLTSSAENLISFFDIFSEIALMDNILSNFESLKFIKSPPQDKPIDIESFNLYYYNVSTTTKLKLKDVGLKIPFRSLVCFVGDEDYKINEVFSLSTRQALPDGGCIFLGDKNLSNIDKQILNKYISSVTPDEQFFNISIYENLYLVCPSRNKIFKETKALHLTDFINSFDDKFNSILDDNLSTKQRFFLGILRAYLSGSKIINIFKFPENLSKSDKELIKHILLTIKKQCSVICYFNNTQFEDVFDEIYYIEINRKYANILSKNANNNNRN